MKHILITTIAAVVLVGCGQSQPTKQPTAKAPDISIHEAAEEGNIEAVKQHLAAGTDVNAKIEGGGTPLHIATHHTQPAPRLRLLLVEDVSYPFSFQFLLGLAAVFADEVGDFGMIAHDGPIKRCVAIPILRIHIRTCVD